MFGGEGLLSAKAGNETSTPTWQPLYEKAATVAKAIWLSLTGSLYLRSYARSRREPLC